MFIIISFLNPECYSTSRGCLSLHCPPAQQFQCCSSSPVSAGQASLTTRVPMPGDLMLLVWGRARKSMVLKTLQVIHGQFNLGRNHQGNPPTFSFHLCNSILSNVNILYLSHIPDSTFFCQSTNEVLINILKVLNTSDHFKL